jgi:two-component system, chemotaxis family, response regulator PixG
MSSGIIDQLKFCRDKRFTGKLCATSLNGDTVETLEGDCWNIYFYRGRLIGDSGGIHPLRRLRRQFSRQCIELPAQIENNILKYLSLNHLSFDLIDGLLTNRYLDREQAEEILAGSLIEVLFDVLHYEAIADAFDKKQLSYILESDPVQELNVPNILMKPETIWEGAWQVFQSWVANGFLPYSPHLSPQINNLEVLQEILATKTFRKIILLLAENRTLRDLAIKIDEEVMILTQSLLVLCKKNALVLRQITDIDLVEKRLTTEIDHEGISNFFIYDSHPSAVFQQKLIVHLTQNPSETYAVQDVVEKAGHQYLNSKESTQALITLLKCSPDLIVIDNSSVGINAPYLCDRLRRTSKFKTTPIIFLSKGDNIIDRLRGSSIDYVTQPLNQQKIFSMLNKYMVQQVS